ncbi:DUF6509 family protein [Sporosarcina sp. Te-1]|uniref:DUF6509 family protein n=1 Tax=Sporosarcina sp. Te-1 TaxID=2818390 RepID=UPI001A9DFD74|nr:DUF6509 family protein [Sporosarcina sp. Te-1]QTD41466.1 pullulanase [Sporosarcina sp. Te-1]
MEIMEYTREELVDPTGILNGIRYEFHLYLQMDPEDELYDEKGTGLRVIFMVDGEQERIASYHFFERSTGDVLDFELDDEEHAEIEQFCKMHLAD